MNLSSGWESPVLLPAGLGEQKVGPRGDALLFEGAGKLVCSLSLRPSVHRKWGAEETTARARWRDGVRAQKAQQGLGRPPDSISAPVHFQDTL